jgi:hypothetical protein
MRPRDVAWRAKAFNATADLTDARSLVASLVTLTEWWTQNARQPD